MRGRHEQAVEDRGLWHGVVLLLLQTVLICLLVGGGYVSLPWLRAAFDKPVARIAVHGELRALDRRAVEEAIVVYETDTFLGIDLDALVDQLEEQPWVARARARRQWPDTVEVHIVEQKPIAYWGEQWMVNAKGRLFEHRGLFQQQNLPRLWSDLSTPAETMGYFQIFEKQLQPLNLALRGISQNVQGDWLLAVDNGMQVLLDRSDPVGNVRHFVTVYRQVVQPSQRQAAVVDMRYRHGAAIRWADMPAPAEKNLSPQISQLENREHGRG